MGAYLFYMHEKKLADMYNRFIVETDEGNDLLKQKLF